MVESQDSKTLNSHVLISSYGGIDGKPAVAASANANTSESARTYSFQCIYIFSTTILGLFLVYCRGRVPGMQGHETTYSVLVICAFVLYPRGTPSAATSTKSKERPGQDPSVNLLLQTPSSSSLALGQSRYYYLDNLKSFMIFCVLFAHLSTGFGATSSLWANGFVIGNFENWFSKALSVVIEVNQSYYMCAFFLISGYFTPSSLAKKGVRDFMRDKFVRLGLPFFAFFFLFSVAVQWFCYSIVGDIASGIGQTVWPVTQGPPWFLQVLLLYNIMFVLLSGDGRVPKVDYPTFKIIMLLGACVGLIQGFFILMGFSLWTTPLVQGSQPFHILFFAGGCLAKHNKWLEQFQDEVSNPCSCVGIAMHCIVVVSIGVIASIQFQPRPPYQTCETSFVTRPEYHLPGFDAQECINMPFNAGPDCLTWDSVAQNLLLMGVLYGLLTVSLSMVIFRWFAMHANFSNSVTVFLSEAAYGVFILHPLVWPLVSWSCVRLLRNMGYTVSFEVCSGLITSSDDIGVGALICSYLYTWTITNAILWPLAFYMKKLPGFDHIL